VNDLPSSSNGVSWGVFEVASTRFHTVAVEFRAASNDRQLRVIDLETGAVLAGRSLQNSEFVLRTENRLDPVFYVGEYTSGTNLKISTYNAGLNVNNSSIVTPVANGIFNFTIPNNNFSVSHFYAPVNAGGEAYFLGYSSGSETLYRGLSGQALQSLPLPSGGSSSDS
jgi:hypothetical protein